MDVVHRRCAGIDISKRDAKVCVRIAGAGRTATKSTVTTWGATTNQILALREHLVSAQVTLVVMEATSAIAATVLHSGGFVSDLAGQRR